ncbi:MAG: ABC transporter substrate-binding protein, partial [Bacillota bacterium]|nr:ABC transporter substrate-binding protein [Bacillota bacterium]
MRRIWAGALLAIPLLLAGCGGSAGEGKAATPNTVVYAVNTEPMVFWDPSDSFSNEIIALNNVYETLLRYDPETATFQGVLATSYESTPDALTWTFHLRSGVKFHTGKEMTAADVKASFDRTISRGKGAAYILDPIDSIETPDSSTVVFHLKYAAPMDLIVSSPYAAYVFDTAPLEANGDDWFNQHHESGSGPYTIKSWKPGDSLVLEKFPDYWGGWKAGQ